MGDLTDLEVVHVEGGREHPAVVRPLLAAQADEPLALELAHHGVRLVAVEVLGAREEDLPDEVRVGDGEARRRAEPDEEGGTCMYVPKQRNR